MTTASIDESLLRTALKTVTDGDYLSQQQSYEALDCLMRADLQQPGTAILAGALLCALRTRREGVEEITGAARCLMDRLVTVPVSNPEETLLDTCGTGGDGAHLVNISTLAALVAASLGVKVAKHGNRSVSSACGSADLLEELGYPLLGDPQQVATHVSETGFGFLFAPHFHPALRNLANLRRTLGIRTLVNLLGPLVNPARASHQLIGVYSLELVEPLARAAKSLGQTKTLIVHGEGGLDELSPWGTTWVCQSRSDSDELQHWEWTPKTFGAPAVNLDALRGGDAKANAVIARELLEGGRPELATVVASNAAAALWVTDHQNDLKTGYAQAYEALRSGQVGRYFQSCITRFG